MKKLIVLVVLMAGITAIAQKPEREKNHRGDRQNMSPEQMAILQTKHMTLALDLTDAQQKQIQSLNLDNAKDRAEKMKEMKSKRESGEAKKLTSDERYAMKANMLDRQIAQKEKIKKILNNEQYEKWEKIKMDRQGHKKGKGMQRHKERANGK